MSPLGSLGPNKTFFLFPIKDSWNSLGGGYYFKPKGNFGFLAKGEDK